MSRKIEIKVIATLTYTPDCRYPEWPDMQAILAKDLTIFANDPLALITDSRSESKVTGQIIDNPRFIEIMDGE